MINIINKIIKMFLFVCFVAGAISSLSLFFAFKFSEGLIITLGILEIIGCIMCLFSSRKGMMQFTCFLYVISLILSPGPMLFLAMLLIATNFIYLALTIFSLELNFGVDMIKIEIDKDSDLTIQEQIDKKLEEIDNKKEEDPK